MAYTVGSASVDIIPDFRKAQLEITKFFNSQKDQLKVPVKPVIDERAKRQVEKDAEDVGDKLGKAINEGSAKNDIAAVKQAQKTANAIAAARRKAEDQAATDAARARDKQFKDEEADFQKSIKNQMKFMDQALKEEAKNSKVRVEIDEADARKKGKELGGAVMRATREEVHQNAGIIALAISGVLAAGAPVATAAAAGLFAGIGAAAAFQNDKLRQSWKGLWNDIKADAIADSATLVPVFDRMAGAIGQSFQRMRPLLRDAFLAVGPQIDSMTASILKASENALPGLVQAVKSAGPVVHGLGDLFEKTGTGVSNFFARISEHSAAGGLVFSRLGDSMAILLPLLGELIGQGAELAANVLPSLNGALGMLLSIATEVSGVLPAVGAAFLAFRAAQGVGRYLDNMSLSLEQASKKGGAFAASQGKASAAIGKVGSALPALGVAFAAASAHIADNQRQIDDWTQALLRGGDAARKAAADAAKSSEGFFNSMLDKLQFGKQESLFEKMFGSDNDEKFAKAQQNFKSLIAAMSPLEAAQQGVKITTQELEDALGKSSTTHAELERLKGRVASASARQAAEEDKLAMATKGVTQAMQDQADAARARVDSAFGYQQAVLDTAEAQGKLRDALNSTDYDSAEEKTAAVAQATLDYNKALGDQVQAAADVATSKLPAAMDDQQKAVLGAKAALDELNKIMATGVVLPPELEAYRQSLIKITGGADGAALAQASLIAALGEVGAAVTAIPESKAVRIDMPTDPLIQKLKDLGFTVKDLPNGAISVEAETDVAKGNLGQLSTLLAGLNTTVAEPTAIVNDQATQPLNDIFGLTQILGGAKPTPVASVNDQATGPLKNLTALSDFLNGKKPTPVASVNDQARTPLQNLIGLSDVLGGKRPTPTAAVNDQASGPIGAINSRLNSLDGRVVTSTIRTVNEVVNKVSNVLQGTGMFGADGGAVGDMPIKNLPRYADGGASPTFRRFDGAITGRGGPRDDLVPMMGANGEHMLDAHDVSLMGGQAGVYAFREMLNSGALRRPASDTGVQQMVMAGVPRIEQRQRGGSTRDVHLYTPDIPTAMRALRAEEHEADALAPAW